MTLPAGFTVGHWTDPVALTGCTVILCDGAATAGVHMGGGAPATIQTDIIGPGSATGILHAVLLTGGSAFGLAAHAGETLAEAPDASADDVGRAVAAARAAQPKWAALSAWERAKVCHAIADLIDERREDFARELSLEQWIAAFRR